VFRIASHKACRQVVWARHKTKKGVEYLGFGKGGGGKKKKSQRVTAFNTFYNRAGPGYASTKGWGEGKGKKKKSEQR